MAVRLVLTSVESLAGTGGLAESRYLSFGHEPEAAVSAALSSYMRRIWRATLAQAPDALVSLDEAADGLPGDPAANASWIAARVDSIAEIAGTRVYRWRDVVAALDADRSVQWLTSDEVAVRFDVSRMTLDAMVGHAPRDLPGAPVQVGRGKKRAHLRWDAARIDDWLKAFRAVQASPTTASTPRRARRSTSEPAVEAVDWAIVTRSLARG